MSVLWNGMAKTSFGEWMWLMPKMPETKNTLDLGYYNKIKSVTLYGNTLYFIGLILNKISLFALV